MVKPANVLVPFLVIALLTSACSPIMAASRSSYRGDVNVIKPGVERTVVIAELGEPDSFSRLENGGYEDRYTMDPDAHSTGVRVLTVLFHVGADLVTAFLWELVATPYEIAVKDRLATYVLIYGPDGKLTSLEKTK